MITRKQDTHSTATDKDTGYLSPFVANAKKSEGDDNDADYGPEIQKLSRKEVGVAVSEDGEVIAFYIHKTQQDVLPAIDEEDFEVFLDTVAIDGIGGVNDGEKDVVEKGLKGGNGGSFVDKESGKGVGCCNAKGKHLSVSCQSLASA